MKLAAVLLLSLCTVAAFAGKCQPDGICTACRDCSRCAWCAKTGKGSCSVCQNQTGAEQRARDARKRPAPAR